MTPQRVVFLNRFYWPDESATAQLLHDLTTALAARGLEVTVITSRPAGSIAAKFEVREGVTIRRVRSTTLGRRHLAGRLLDFLTYYAGALARLLLHLKSGDTVVVMTDPPLLGVCVWPIAALRGASVVNWVQDVYPEVALALTGHQWLKLIRPLRNAAWRASRALVVPGIDMRRTLLENGVDPRQVVVSPNWAPAGVQVPDAAAVKALRSQWGLEGKFVVMYSGNLGRVHDLEPLIEVADLLRHESDIVFLFVGHGARRAALESAVRQRALGNVVFRPPQPRPALSSSLGVGDIHCVTLLPAAERWVFPSKLYGIAKAGRPVLFVGETDSEIAELVRTHQFGLAFSRNSPADVAAAITALRNENVRLAQMAAASQAFSSGNLDAAISAWYELLSHGLAAEPVTGAYLQSK